jgi:LysM repeat protein
MTRISSSLGVAIPDLEKVNNLASNAVLQVGQVLKVPEKVVTQAATTVTAGVSKLSGAIASTVSPSQSAETNAPASTSPAQTGPTTEYTVVKGDNPWKIAKKFKISQDELMKANGITDPKKIQIGQQLKIPAPAAKGSK